MEVCNGGGAQGAGVCGGLLVHEQVLPVTVVQWYPGSYFVSEKIFLKQQDLKVPDSRIKREYYFSDTICTRVILYF
jgi:hypothetical protein